MADGESGAPRASHLLRLRAAAGSPREPVLGIERKNTVGAVPARVAGTGPQMMTQPPAGVDGVCPSRGRIRDPLVARAWLEHMFCSSLV